MKNKNFKGMVVSSVSGLLLVAAGSTSAVEFDVGDTAVKLSGYAKLDLIYDVDSDLGNLITHRNIRLDKQNGPDGHSRMQAIQSRLRVSTLTPTTASGPVKTVIEGDFFGNGGGDLRLRHAYGVWNGILAGQTTTNFTSFLGFTPTIDFLGPLGEGNLSRQAQLRYTAGDFSVALEDPGSLGGASTILAAQSPEPIIPNASSQNNIPDLTLRYESSAGSIAYATSAVVRQLGVYDADTDSEEKAFGYGVSLAAKLTLEPAVSIQGAVVYGDGVGGYMYARSLRGRSHLLA